MALSFNILWLMLIATLFVSHKTTLSMAVTLPSIFNVKPVKRFTFTTDILRATCICFGFASVTDAFLNTGTPSFNEYFLQKFQISWLETTPPVPLEYQCPTPATL